MTLLEQMEQQEFELLVKAYWTILYGRSDPVSEKSRRSFQEKERKIKAREEWEESVWMEYLQEVKSRAREQYLREAKQRGQDEGFTFLNKCMKQEEEPLFPDFLKFREEAWERDFPDGRKKKALRELKQEMESMIYGV